MSIIKGGKNGKAIEQGDWVKSLLIERIRLELRYRKKLKEMRKRDPFIYK